MCFAKKGNGPSFKCRMAERGGNIVLSLGSVWMHIWRAEAEWRGNLHFIFSAYLLCKRLSKLYRCPFLSCQSLQLKVPLIPLMHLQKKLQVSLYINMHITKTGYKTSISHNHTCQILMIFLFLKFILTLKMPNFLSWCNWILWTEKHDNWYIFSMLTKTT